MAGARAGGAMGLAQALTGAANEVRGAQRERAGERSRLGAERIARCLLLKEGVPVVVRINPTAPPLLGP